MVDVGQIAIFFLVLTRISTFFVAGPVFSLPNIPGLVKMGLSLALAVIVFPVVSTAAGNITMDGWDYVFALLREVLVGLTLGFVTSLVLNALMYAGSLIDMHIGFFMSSIFDPMSGSMAAIMSRFLHLLGLAVLLGFNGHHIIIAALVKSYQVVPVNSAKVSAAAALLLIKVFGQMIVIGVQIAAPLIAVMLIIDVTLGLLARTAPQINVFMLGFPIKIVFGLLTLSVMVPVIVRIIYSMFSLIEQDMLTLMRGMT